MIDLLRHTLLGVPFSVVDNDATVLTKNIQFRFPRSHKERIRKKFRRDRRNWKNILVGYQCFQTPHGIIMPRVIYNELIQKAAQHRSQEYDTMFSVIEARMKSASVSPQ